MSIQELAKQIETLTGPEKLRLAAELIEHGRLDVAKPIVDTVATELGAVLLLRATRKA